MSSLAKATIPPHDWAASLDKMSVAELTALRDAADAKRAEKLEAAKDSVLATARKELSELGMTLEGALSIETQSAAVRKAGKVSAKYRSPNGDSWSGRGRSPKWLAQLISQGHRKEEYSIE